MSFPLPALSLSPCSFAAWRVAVAASNTAALTPEAFGPGPIDLWSNQIAWGLGFPVFGFKKGLGLGTVQGLGALKVPR